MLLTVNPAPFAGAQRQLMVAAPSGHFVLSALLNVSCDNSLGRRRTVVRHERVGAGLARLQATSTIVKMRTDGRSTQCGRDLDPSGVRCRHTVVHLRRRARVAVLNSLA